MESLWEASCELPGFSAQERDFNTEVLIIGGGLAGILTAKKLHTAGIPYALVEAKTICSGITKNTTAKITSQHGLIYSRLISEIGVKGAKKYLEANQAAVNEYRELCKDIDCDFEDKPSYIYSTDSPKGIESELNALERLGYPAEYARSLPLPFKTAGAVKFPKQAQFNPMKFVCGLARGLNIFENTRVTELIGTTAITNRGRINAKRVIVATHFPFINKHGLYFLKLYQHRSYVIALDGAQDVGGMYLEEGMSGLSFRNYRDLLLLGGGDHRTGKGGGGWSVLRSFAEKNYPGSRIRHRWATQDCMSLDGIPYIGKYSAATDRLYVATGFNKWGMTSSMAAAGLLCDLVQDRKSPYEELFSPSRSIIKPQLFVNGFEAAVSLVTPTPKRCPHMGCALKWNALEHSWDCPCHGSRFTGDGRLIDNPSTGDMKPAKSKRRNSFKDR